ncbi:hypothetical protein FQN54_006081 [Arachnomyces sp. PD_36]|nr:hypothetical protein FQN54_006081 [Arachnomyces sp. PD_36]
MTAESTTESGSGKKPEGSAEQKQQQQQQQRRRSSLSHHPKRLIFAPGDIPASHPSSPAPPLASNPITTTTTATSTAENPEPATTDTPDATTDTDTTLLTHPSRAHQFLTNPPLHLPSLHPTSPLHQFHTWFSDPRLPPSTSPETCTLATASLPSGRVSARIVYLKELDERGWVVYSNWGSKLGKGGDVGDVFGNGDGENGGEGGGNRWVALTFHWRGVERQVRVEGVAEGLERGESETYWRTRERGSQIGGWASWQSKVLWRSGVVGGRDGKGVDVDVGAGGEVDDGREVLEKRVREVEEKFKDTEEIPLPPFWGGVRIVPESVEFWQGRKSRLHDRFRYVRVHDEEGNQEGEGEEFKWVIERLSP